MVNNQHTTKNEPNGDKLKSYTVHNIPFMMNNLQFICTPSFSHFPYRTGSTDEVAVIIISASLTASAGLLKNSTVFATALTFLHKFNPFSGVRFQI